jgi:hypothetical protein
MATSDPGISVLENLITHADPTVLFKPSNAFRRGMTLTLPEMLIQREKNVEASLPPKDQDQ